MGDLRLGSRCLVGWSAKLHVLLVLAMVLGLFSIMLPSREVSAATLPSITYTNDCPDYSQFISDVASAGAGQSLTITFATGFACDYGVGQTVTVNPGAIVTIVGNGLIIYGGGNSIPLISVGSHAGLNLSGTTLWDAKNGIDASSTTGAAIGVTNCKFTSNAANGINAGSSTDVYIKATGTTFSGNVDNGISAADATGPTIALSNSEFDSSVLGAVNVNTADSPTVSIDTTTMTNNGNGITADDADGATIAVDASTFFSDSAAIYAVSAKDSTIVVFNSTIDGGTHGIELAGSARLLVNITSSTIANNALYGIDVSSATDPAVTLTATILDGNTPDNCSGSIIDGGYNRVTDTSCNLTASTSQVVDASSLDLQGLNYNGGPTLTMALGPNSVAIDQIPLNADGSCAAGEQTDQRGVSRPQGLACDIGAYEAPGRLMFLPGDTLVVHRGYWALIRIAVLDTSGRNISTRSLQVNAFELDGNGQTIPFAHTLQFGTFSGQPGYQLSINARNLAAGNWQLWVRIGSNPTPAMIPFTVE